ncbi:RecX family transcriptional regulator [Sphingomonas cannabina]|uniref:RecX family transcriptional regulator n=1 Tax=Sphingomonas cannabina TaxID=2899123 RepID=UPI001F4174CD|nr:RecX family transcriptional regulator [Sphingomonas cannabina]UIJ44464.1 RecX family transcriptional regulator [Sphingomonas cannabina]
MSSARPRPALDPSGLERLALRYVERFATTETKLRRYLDRKIRERGWDGPAPPDPAAIARRMTTLGYVDDAAFAEARAASMARRGLGARRIAGELRHAGIGEDEMAALQPVIAARARQSALAFARRRRIGPYAAELPDRAARERALGQLLRAGHPLELARWIVAMKPGEVPFSDVGETVQNG